MPTLELSESEALLLEQCLMDMIDVSNQALKNELSDEDYADVSDQLIEQKNLLGKITELTLNRGG